MVVPSPRVPELVQRFRQTNLVEYFQNRGVDRVAAKVAVEILVHLKQRNPNTFSRQKQCEHHAPGPPPTVQQVVSCESRMCSVGFDWGAGITSVAIMILRAAICRLYASRSQPVLESLAGEHFDAIHRYQRP